MRRRSLLGTLTGIAIGSSPPMVTLEALRQGLGVAIDAGRDEWQMIAADYAVAYYTTAHGTLLQRVQADLLLLQQLMSAQPESRDLARAAGQMAAVMAMIMSAAGEARTSRRWWSTARLAADKSHDMDTRVLVRAYDAVSGLYDGRSADVALRLADETLALAGGRVCAGTAGALACRAQALAIQGRAAEATTAVRQVEAITGQMPAGTVAADESLFGWPEHRMRHTQSYVYTRTGQVAEAGRAQDLAIPLYPQSQGRLRAQVQMHRACCLIQGGDIGDGLRYATDALDVLPPEQHNEILYEVVRVVAATVPSPERQRAEFDDLRQRMPALPAR